MTEDRSGLSRSFGRVAADYHRYRPRTPEALLDWLLPPHATAVADLAAGTGVLSELLVPRVPRVLCIEPDAGMRAILTREVPDATPVGGTAEALPLADGVLDAVFVSSAWHWFDADRASGEIARVLAPGGRLALVGTSFDPEVDWVLALRRPIAGADPRDRPSAATPSLPEGAPFDPPETREVSWQWELTREELLGLLGTYSRVIVASPTERSAMMQQAEQALQAEPATRDRQIIDVPMRSWAARFTRRG